MPTRLCAASFLSFLGARSASSFSIPSAGAAAHGQRPAFARKMTDTSTPTTEAPAATATDPHAFLEEVLSEDSLAWVDARNAACFSALGDPGETADYARLLSIMDSADKIPGVAQIGDGDYYNFWQDETHVQGIWRRTSPASYKTGSPEWTTVLDLDALDPPDEKTAAATGTTWVWHGSTLLDEGPGGKWDRALIALSPGGSDADTTREIDLVSGKFVGADDGGFELPKAAKTSCAYRTRDELLIGTDFAGDGSTMTDSGYPRVIKSWKRGTPLSEAVTIFEAEQADIAGAQFAYHDRGAQHEFRMRQITFYTSTYEYRVPVLDGSQPADAEGAAFQKVPIPEDASIGTYGTDAMITLRTDWCPPGSDTTYVAGSLLVTTMSAVMASDFSDVLVMFTPTPAKSLSATTSTKDYIVLSVLEDVRTTLVLWKRGDDGTWTNVPAPEDAVKVGEDVSLGNVNRDDAHDNAVFLWRNGYLVPETLELVADVGTSLAAGEPLKAGPAHFDAAGLIVEQNFCASADGTRIPYFVIRRADAPLDGENPTLLDAYGGFEISMLPGYSAGVGAAWLEAGGVKVIANIRGGGEYGPAWHQAALREKKYKSYEDMEAVAQDLIDRKITSPAKLACIGGSNGGLMVGNLLTRPISSRLFGAAVCQVPLLDMKVYSKLLAGASWMAEYGNPDVPGDWSFLRKHSAYHMLRHDCLGLSEDGAEGVVTDPEWQCPKTLFTTSTRDDRVHPGHARKMVRSLLEEARPLGKADVVHYWENIEGGHGGAADNKQRAKMWALTYSFLKQTLGLRSD